MDEAHSRALRAVMPTTVVRTVSLGTANGDTANGDAPSADPRTMTDMATLGERVQAAS
jgi:hypothetical protein